MATIQSLGVTNYLSNFKTAVAEPGYHMGVIKSIPYTDNMPNGVYEVTFSGRMIKGSGAGFMIFNGGTSENFSYMIRELDVNMYMEVSKVINITKGIGVFCTVISPDAPYAEAAVEFKWKHALP